MPDTKLLQDDYDDGLIRQFFRTARAFSRTLNGAVSQEDIHSSEWMVLNLTARHPGIMQGLHDKSCHIGLANLGPRPCDKKIPAHAHTSLCRAVCFSSTIQTPLR